MLSLLDRTNRTDQRRERRGISCFFKGENSKRKAVENRENFSFPRGPSRGRKISENSMGRRNMASKWFGLLLLLSQALALVASLATYSNRFNAVLTPITTSVCLSYMHSYMHAYMHFVTHFLLSVSTRCGELSVLSYGITSMLVHGRQ